LLWRPIGEETVAKKPASFRATPLHQLIWKTLPPEIRGELFLRDIRESWRNLAGDPLGKCTAPFKIRESTLFVMAEHSPAAQEVQFQERRILERIRKAFSLELSRIRVTVGNLPRGELFSKDPEEHNKMRKRYTFSRQEVLEEEKNFDFPSEKEDLQHSLAELRVLYKKRFGK